MPFGNAGGGLAFRPRRFGQCRQFLQRGMPVQGFYEKSLTAGTLLAQAAANRGRISVRLAAGIPAWCPTQFVEALGHL